MTDTEQRGSKAESEVLWMSTFHLTQFQVGTVHPRLKIIKLQDVFRDYHGFDSASFF